MNTKHLEEMEFQGKIRPNIRKQTELDRTACKSIYPMVPFFCRTRQAFIMIRWTHFGNHVISCYFCMKHGASCKTFLINRSLNDLNRKSTLQTSPGRAESKGAAWRSMKTVGAQRIPTHLQGFQPKLRHSVMWALFCIGWLLLPGSILQFASYCIQITVPSFYWLRYTEPNTI